MKLLRTKVYATAEKTRTGFSAHVDKLGVYTTGKSFRELKKNLINAVNFQLEDDNLYIDESNLRVSIDMPQLFEFYDVLNARAVANKIGMNPSLLSQYINGKKKLSATQSEKVLKGVREIGKELSSLNFK